MPNRSTAYLALALLAALGASALAGDWARWRGPLQNGATTVATNLPESWDPYTGENVAWTADAGGMSSPVVMNGRVYTWTRINDITLGEGDNKTAIAGPQTQEALVCIDAATGRTLWTHTENVTQTDVPFHRLGWGNVVADPATNRVYGLGVQCKLICLDGDTGKEIWSRQMTEEFGMISTFGGRTPSPAIDEDQLFIAGVAFGWGDHGQSGHRIFAFDKTNGELRWSNNTGGRPVDAPYNTPVIAMIDGQKQVVFAAGDGGVHGFQARTGKQLWSYKASKRGLNASVIVDGSRVFVCHSEENVNSAVMGAVSCIEINDNKVTEVWRVDGIEAGFASPVLADNRLYVMENSGRVHALNPSDGTTYWKRTAGTIGKASLVHADGKLYVPEANGRFSILKPEEKTAKVLSRVEINEKYGREYVIFGSVAVADGRVYLQTANKLYAIGPKELKPTPSEPQPKIDEGQPGPVAQVQVVPAYITLKPGEKVTFRAIGYDEKGRKVGPVKANWQLSQVPMPLPPTAPKDAPRVMIGNLQGTLSATEGETVTFTASGDQMQGGAVQASAGDITAHGRARVFPPPPINIDFANDTLNKPPLTWVNAGGKFAVREKDGDKVLVKLTDLDLYHVARTYFGDYRLANYTIDADIQVGAKTIAGQRQMPDAGVINSKYGLSLLGNRQLLQIAVWPGALPTEMSPSGILNTAIPYAWEPDTWYHLKLRVDQENGKAIARGKVWKKGDKEPEAWMISLEDPLPNTSGSPGLFGESLVTPAKSEIYYDNISVTTNK